MIVKICGHTNLADAIASVDAGADWLGFVFIPSPDVICLSTKPACGWTGCPWRPNGWASSSMNRKIVRQLLAARLIDVAQLHVLSSRISATHSLRNSDRIASSRRLRVFRPDSLDEIARFDLPVMLLDGPEPGSGRVFDWNPGRSGGRPLRGQKFARGRPDAGQRRRRSRESDALGVDTASGVESGPGIEGSRKGGGLHRCGARAGRLLTKVSARARLRFRRREGGSGKN